MAHLQPVPGLIEEFKRELLLAVAGVSADRNVRQKPWLRTRSQLKIELITDRDCDCEKTGMIVTFRTLDLCSIGE